MFSQTESEGLILQIGTTIRLVWSSCTDCSESVVCSSGSRKQGAWKLFTEISSEPAAVLYSYCAPSTSARLLPRQRRGPKQLLYEIQLFSARSSFHVGFLHLYVSLHAFLEICLPSASSSCILRPANVMQAVVLNAAIYVHYVFSTANSLNGTWQTCTSTLNNRDYCTHKTKYTQDYINS